MSHAAQYQVVILEPGPSRHGDTIRATVRRHVAELGLKPDDHLRFLDETNYNAEFQPQDPVAGIYFGGPASSAATTAVADDLLRRFAFVLPVVEALSGYTSKVPSCLKPINGLQLSKSDPNLEEPAGRLLEELRLIRRRRAAFISYKRVESHAAASQVFHSLEERQYRVFLDTFGVEHGRRVQETLWNRMLDTEILVFLHTPGVLSSPWVEQEFARANQLALGILNLVWPGHTPPASASLGEMMYLDASHFVSGTDHRTGDGRLQEEVLREIAVRVEALRARSIADRRRRIVDAFGREVDAFVRRTGSSKLKILVGPVGHLEIRRGRKKPARVYPIVGHPDTEYAREIADACSVDGFGGYLLFDPNGMDDDMSRHLRWLNDYLPVRTFSITEVGEWLPKL